MMVKIFCFFFFFNRNDSIYDSLFFFRQIHKKFRFPGLLRFLLQISHNMTTIRVKKKLIKMGGWDGEVVEIKELKKKIFHQLISCSDLTRKHSSCETQWGPNLLWNCILNFPAIIFTRFISRAFSSFIMNEKALIERKKISWNQGVDKNNWNATSKWLWSHCA